MCRPSAGRSRPPSERHLLTATDSVRASSRCLGDVTPGGKTGGVGGGGGGGTGEGVCGEAVLARIQLNTPCNISRCVESPMSASLYELRRREV